MDSILRVLRVKGKRFLLLSFITIFTLSFLSACSDNGPDDDGENNASTNGSQTNVSQSAANPSTDNTQTLTGLVVTDTASNLCQQQNLLMCETFEWSSSLAYQATNTDWSLNGWQFSGSNASGLFCSGGGAAGSQCALKWSQANTADNTLQKATKIFSEYGAAESRVTINWSAKWSSLWQWDATPFVKLGIFDRNQVLETIVSLNVDKNGIVQLDFADDYICPGQKKTVQADIGNTPGNVQPGKWQEFKLVYDASAADNNVTVQLTINNAAVLSTTSVDLSCGSNNDNLGLNAVSFVASSFNPNSMQQTMQVDNVVVSYP